MRYCLAALLIICVFLLTACSYVPFLGAHNSGSGKKLPVQAKAILQANSKAGNELGQLLAKGQPAEGPILLATFVNLDNLEESSSLGRIIPQQIGTELANHGFEVLDIRLRTDTVQVKASQGEFALSRKLQAIAQEQETYAVLVGTYSVLYEQVYVNAKILKGSNKMTLAATDYFLPYEPEILHPEGFAGQNTDNRLNIQPNVRTSLK